MLVRLFCVQELTEQVKGKGNVESYLKSFVNVGNCSQPIRNTSSGLLEHLTLNNKSFQNAV